MKKLISFSAIFIFILGLTGCDLGGKSNYTPVLSMYYEAFLNSDSTIRLKYNDAGNIKIDSLHVNDTVTLGLIFNGISNNLVKFEIASLDPNDIEMIIPHDSVTKFFGSNSDFANGKIYFPEGISAMNYPFQFVTKKVNEKAKISFMLTSDAKDVANTSGLAIEFPIK